MTLIPHPADYSPWLADLKRRIQGARSCAVLAYPNPAIGQQLAAQLTNLVPVHHSVMADTP